MSRPSLLLVFALAAVACMPAALALSPPAWVRAREIQATLAWDSSLNIALKDEGNNNLVITVNVPTTAPMAKAQALASAVAPYGTVSYGSSGTKIKVTYGNKVILPQALPTEGNKAFDLLQTALKGSALFKRGVAGTNPMMAQFFLIMQNKSVQYWTDDISQWQGFTTKTAAAAVADVYGVSSLKVTDSQVNSTTEVVASTIKP